MQTYVNETYQARAAVSDIVRLVQEGRVEPVIHFDTETAPMPGLEGYPGTVFDQETQKWVKANKKSYLEFAQHAWKAAFVPGMLQRLGLFIPEKTLSGKEGGVDAKDLWKAFLERVYVLEASPESRQMLENARWTHKDVEDAREANQQRYAELADTRATLQSQQLLKVTKKREGQIAKLEAQLQEVTAYDDFLTFVVTPRIERPVDLRLLTHVVKVGVESRVYLTPEGQNRLDPVRPGLDPYTSTIFLVQVTLREKATKKLLSWNFNTHKVDIHELAPIFKLPKVLYTGANVKFDLKMLMVHLGFAPKNTFCTRVASRILYLGLLIGHSLADVARRFCGIEMAKEVRNTFVGRRYEEPTPEQMTYAYADTEVLPAIVDAQLEKARSNGQEQLVRDFSNLSWITARWETLGYRIDPEAWLEINAGAARERDRIASELEEMLLPQGYRNAFASDLGSAQVLAGLTGDDSKLRAQVEEDLENVSEDAEEDARPDAVIRISQGKLVLTELERILKMNLASVCPNGKPSLSKDARSAMEREYRARNGGQGHPFFQQYALWSKLAKQVSTYGKRFLWYIHPMTGNIHPSFNIAGTDTARFSSTGPNWLNIPAAKEPGDPDFRGAIIAHEGHYFLGADYETMELRIAGDISGDPMVKALVESKADAHGFTAANMFHIVPGNVKEPTAKQEVYRRGTATYDITVWIVPHTWNPEQVAEFALSETGTGAVKEVKAKYGKDITRGDAKSVTFLWLFQGTPFTLAQRTGLPQDICEDLFRRFAGVYNVMDSHMKGLANSVYSNQFRGADGRLYAYSEGYGGIRRYVELPDEPEQHDYPGYAAFYAASKEYQRQMRRASRELCNLPMQGGNAVITCKALLKLVKDGERKGIEPTMCIYDEIIARAPLTTSAETTKIYLEDAMLSAAEPFMTYVPAGAEADVEKAGTKWVKS
jgi:DNA polymerase I-like protein with 3'-5' exonuclease and polymerase domains